MTSVNEKSFADPMTPFEDGMSVQAPPVKSAQAEAAKSPEAADADSFSVVDTVKSFFGVEKPKAKANESKYGPDNLPQPPQPPRRMAQAGADLSSEKIVAKDEWNKYAKAYSQYLKDYEGVFANCKDLQQLKRSQPQPPDDALARTGIWDSKAQAMKDEYEGMFSKKVTRGYELAKETPPGTFTAMLKGTVGLEAGPVNVGGEFAVETDDKKKPVISFGADAKGVGFSGSTDGSREVSVEVGGYGGKVSSDGEVQIKVGHGAGAIYNPKEAKVGASLSVGKEIEGPAGTKARAELELQATAKLISQEDVRRVFENWLVAPPAEDANEKWLRARSYGCR